MSLSKAFTEKIKTGALADVWRDERGVQFADGDWGRLELRRWYPGDGSVEVRLDFYPKNPSFMTPRDASSLAAVLAEASELSASLEMHLQDSVCKSCGHHLFDPGAIHAQWCEVTP